MLKKKSYLHFLFYLFWICDIILLFVVIDSIVNSIVVLFCACSDHSYDYVLEPSPVQLPLREPQKTRVTQVSCGRAHTLVLTDREGGQSQTPSGRLNLYTYHFNE